MIRNPDSLPTQSSQTPFPGQKSLSVKLARNLPKKKRAKRQLAGLYEVLKPGSFVTKSPPTTTIINEPGRSPVKVRNTDLAKFGTKAERSTNLWMYAQRRPAPYEQTTETKIAKHSNDLKRQKRGEIKIRHRQLDAISVVSSINSNVSRALTVRKPVKPQPKRRRNPNITEPSDTALTSPQQLISIVPAPLAPTRRDYHEPSMSSTSHDQFECRKKTKLNFTALQTRLSLQQVLWLKQVSLEQVRQNQRNAEPKRRRKLKIL